MNLFMISLGGKVPGANIEVHDVQFVASESIDDTVEILKSNWYGRQEKLHMDSYKKIVGANGYRVNLSKEKPNGDKRLFFTHIGAYDKNHTQEIHKVEFFVAESSKEAKERALIETKSFGEISHVDQVIDVEACLLTVDGEKYYIELQKSEDDFDLKPDWFGYRRLDI